MHFERAIIAAQKKCAQRHGPLDTLCTSQYMDFDQTIEGGPSQTPNAPDGGAAAFNVPSVLPKHHRQ